MLWSELLEIPPQGSKFLDILTIICISFVAKSCRLLHGWSGTFNIQLNQKWNQANTEESRWLLWAKPYPTKQSKIPSHWTKQLPGMFPSYHFGEENSQTTNEPNAPFTLWFPKLHPKELERKKRHTTHLSAEMLNHWLTVSLWLTKSSSFFFEK